MTIVHYIVLYIIMMVYFWGPCDECVSVWKYCISVFVCFFCNKM